MPINNNLIQQIGLEAKKHFQGASGCHDWTHVERVKKLSLYIGGLEKADLNILEIAVLLHDIGRKEEIKSKGLFCHAEKGAETAKRILEKYNVDQKTIDSVGHCIKSHRFRNNNVPETIEAKVLFDADKLDSIGAVGIARDFLFAGNAGSGNLYTGNEKEISRSGKDHSFGSEDSAILEYEIKLKHIKDKMMTSTGKRIAEERHRFMEVFFERFWEEVDGKK
jgi:uncharacterized protein